MRKTIIVVLILLIGLLAVSIFAAYLITRQDNVTFGDKVAVIPLYGTLAVSQDSGAFAEEGTTPDKFSEDLSRAEKDPSVKAIVIDINSPGGSVIASKEMVAALEACKKPTVAWLGEIATSGAYYVASSADYIVADSSSITGSIGVISIFPEYSKLLEKIGVNMTVIKAGEYKDFSTGFRPMTEEEKKMMEEVLQEVYDEFLGTVASNRDLSDEYVRSVAEGKIYTGKKAKELHLVDEIGNKNSAIRIAARMGGIEGEPNVVNYGRKRLFEEFIGSAFAKLGYGFARGLVESQTLKY